MSKFDDPDFVEGFVTERLNRGDDIDEIALEAAASVIKERIEDEDFNAGMLSAMEEEA